MFNFIVLVLCPLTCYLLGREGGRLAEKEKSEKKVRDQRRGPSQSYFEGRDQTGVR